MKCPHGIPFDKECEYCETIRKQALGILEAVKLKPPTLSEKIPFTSAWHRRKQRELAVRKMIQKAQKAWSNIMELRNVASSSRDQ